MSNTIPSDMSNLRERVNHRTQIVSVVERYISLRAREPAYQKSPRIGSWITEHTRLHNASSRFIGDCPLCDVTGDQGSLSVYEQAWFCDDCGQHGDVVDFTSAVEGISESSALERLAVQCGL